MNAEGRAVVFRRRGAPGGDLCAQGVISIRFGAGSRSSSRPKILSDYDCGDVEMVRQSGVMLRESTCFAKRCNVKTGKTRVVNHSLGFLQKCLPLSSVLFPPLLSTKI